MKRSLILFFWLSLCLPLIALAELPEQVSDDFSVLAGVIIMPIGTEFMVDLDARDNLHVGDILTLVTPGKKILHPVSKEVLGTVDTPIGFLQVTRLHSGYSYVKALTEELAPESGDPVKRFEQVAAVLVGETEENRELARQIKLNLPQFQWLDSNQGVQQALLTFTLQSDALDVTNQQGDSLHKYKVSKDQQLVNTTRSVPRSQVPGQSGPKPMLLQGLANDLIGAFGQSNEERFAEMDAAIIRKKQADDLGIWRSPNLAGHPTGMTVADLDGDGLQEIAIVLEKKILIARITEGQFNELAEVDLPGSLQVLSIDALDLDNDGRSELYLSALAANRTSSLVIQYDGSNYGIVQAGIRWFLRAVMLPGEADLRLVGQRIDNTEQVFTGDVFRLQSKAGELVEGNPVDLPDRLNLFNFMPFTDDSNQLNYLYLTDGDYLNVISADGEVLWQSDNYYGGSEDCFMVQEKLRDEEQIPYCMRPRFVMTPANEIVVVQNDGQRMVQRYRAFKKSRLVSLAWNGFALTERWKTASQPGYLSDFALADADNDGKNEIVMAVKFNHSGSAEKIRSAVVIYELD